MAWRNLETNICRSSTRANKNCHIQLPHKNCSYRRGFKFDFTSTSTTRNRQGDFASYWLLNCTHHMTLIFRLMQAKERSFIVEPLYFTGVQEWRSGESSRLPPMWSDSQIWRHMSGGLSLLVLFSVPRGFLRVLRFPLSSKTTIWLDLC